MNKELIETRLYINGKNSLAQNKL